jgi:hypothetical protein
LLVPRNLPKVRYEGVFKQLVNLSLQLGLTEDRNTGESSIVVLVEPPPQG